MPDCLRERCCNRLRSSPFVIATYAFLALTAIAQAGNPPGEPHPVIPGFERFFTVPNADRIQGGRLLLAELNCTSCHAGSACKQFSSAKQAPILTDVGLRVRRGYLRRFLNDPQAVKPGTAMPNVFAGLSEQERNDSVEALVQLLASTGTVRHEQPQYQFMDKGRKLYQEIGCVACHGSRDAVANPDKVLPTSVPLGDLAAKYTIPSLTEFLADPLHARPSGRMPVLLKKDQARQVAHFLLRSLPAPPATLSYTYYEGDWDKLPDFNKLRPRGQGKVNDFNVGVARRANNFGLKFEGQMRIDRDGDYRFILTSDDGSRLEIDGQRVVDNDGVHAPQTKSGATRLAKGMHKVVVLFFQGPGGAELAVDIQGPGLTRQPLAPLLFLEANPPKAVQSTDDDLTINPALVQKGVKVFAAMGCANCHQLKNGGKVIAPQLKTRDLSEIKAEGGCLAPKPHKGVPRFALNMPQRQALTAALKGLNGAATAKTVEQQKRDMIAWTMSTLNCYACHQRDKVGGVEPVLDKYFVTTQPEMGEEGRLPPPLDGVGAKMNPAYFKHILANGADDRPYMLTSMPGFGAANTSHLTELFADLDHVPVVKPITFADAPGKVRAAGRHMVGAQAFGCIKCHTFAGNKAEGVQGIDMTLMTQRVNRDWFHYYLLDPQKYRPGTRMPSAWPEGQSPLNKVLGGSADKQIEAIWVYLADGKKASLPVGLGKHFIELIPEKEAIIYRNFIAGAGPRAIGVGFPERANLAFDANNMRLALIWHGAFIDASRHWTDRGVGFQPPLGDNVMSLPDGPTFAVLGKATDAWPNQKSKDLGYKFHSYRLTADQRPTFIYSFNGIRIEDAPNAIEAAKAPFIRRTLTLHAAQPVAHVYLRAAVANKIEAAGNGWYTINSTWKLRIEGGMPQVRQSGGHAELLVPVQFNGQQAVRIVQEYVW
jgi:mono/diheme cytochrome c family protein